MKWFPKPGLKQTKFVIHDNHSPKLKQLQTERKD